ncbi:site-specific integrase [Marinobacterium rhizophilum]|uniref:Site-specific integrase n=1 Tax=Marinobacterium rhizophilum TaxID=420402 RepID=A0ABY5HM48_9GAMM|nr:site-specific integrase [Marinobacterium rhizophilum]UTW13375.1 site-specific integrase [Marinobacterium rhizophilum]
MLLEQMQAVFSSVEQGRKADLSTVSWKRPERDSVPRIATPLPVLEAPEKACPKLSVVLEQYLKAQRREGVGEKTLGDKKSIVELLIRIVGDLPMHRYQRQQAQQFKETALQLPPRVNQKGKVSLEQLIAEAETTISTTTFNNYVKYLTAFFGYAVQEEYCEKNPFDGMKVKQRVKASEGRSRFTEDDLKRLFAADVYARRDGDKPYQYWLPLLGLYTGARMNELCQLYLDDVVTINGIDCIHFREGRDDQKLKTPTSERVVPIHSRLKEAGFLQYVEQRRELGEDVMLFDLVRHKRHGYAATPSKWFARYRDKLGFKGGKEKKDFHSFRHTVADHLKQQGVAESLVGGLLGHQTGGITFSRYGKDFTPEVLVPVVGRIEIRAL